MRAHATAAGTVEGAVTTRTSVDASLAHLRVATIDGSSRISALNASATVSNRTVPTLNRIITALNGAASALDTPVATGIPPFDGASSDAASVAGSDAGGAVTVAATEFTAVPTVVHADMLSVRGTEVVAVAMIVAVSAYSVPSVGTTIGEIEVRTSEVEVVTVRITGIDAEVPVTGVPVQRAIEIGSC